MIKDIVVNLAVAAEHDAVTDFSVSVAGAFEAHLAAIAFVYEPFVPGSVFGGTVATIVQAARAQALSAAQAAVDKFEQAARGRGLSAESRQLDTALDGAAGLFGRIARRYDMSIVAQPEPEAAERGNLIVEAALFESGRPVLVVPYIQKAGLKLDRAMVCWDGSRPAARAIADAMPFLQRTKAVELVTVVRGPGNSHELPGVDMGHHLARHGLKVEVKHLVASDIDVPNAILSHAADAGTDIIVMGGYGHSRMREFVLGGATRGILATMTVPVLMSH
jgi:nucleotide-binding universal stress UspA family protein